MINDFMSIMPVRVWMFWLFVFIGALGLAVNKAYRKLRADNRALAKMIIERKNESV